MSDRIGAKYEDGIYAGLSIENERPVALILLPGDTQAPWKDAIAWAEKQGGMLPSRIDHLVLFKNLKGEFKETWYWSDEQYANASGYAWTQLFGNGYQNYDFKSNVYRARAVRRISL